MPSSNSWRGFFAKGILGTAVFALANVVVYYGNGYFERERHYHEVVDEFFTRPAATILFVGDSHVAQLDNDYLTDTVYNAAVGGDSLRECYAKFRYLLSRGAKIDTLYLTADAHMFATGRIKSSNGAFADEYLLRSRSPYGLDRGRLPATFNLIPLLNDDFVQYFKKWLSLGLKGQHIRAGDDDTDWQKLSDADRRAISTRTGEMDHRGAGDSPEPLQWYGRILQEARAHGVRVLAIRYPSEPEYLASITPQASAKVDSGLHALGVEEIVDLSGAFSDPAYFSDPDHVSHKGALAFLRLLQARTGQKLLTDAPIDPNQGPERD